MMGRQISSLDRQVDELFDLQRFSEGDIDLHCEAVDLSTIAAEAAESLQKVGRTERFVHRLADDDKCMLTLGLPSRRPNRYELALERHQVRWWAAHRGGNRPRGGARSTCRCAIMAWASRPMRRLRIFETFKRAISTTPQYPGLGLGLGLWTTNLIVEACGSAVAVESQPGQGATFTVELPIDWVQADKRYSGPIGSLLPSYWPPAPGTP